MLLELRPDRPGQRVPNPDDILKLIERDRALATVPFLQPARQREPIQQIRHRHLGRHLDANSSGRRMHARPECRDDAGEPALELSIELLTVGPLNALG